MPPRIATRRRPAPRSARWRSAASIEVGFALYASLTTKPPPGSGELLAAPGRDPHRRCALGQPVERQAERVVGGQRGESVLRLVARGEREADPAAAERDVARRRRGARRRPVRRGGSRCRPRRCGSSSADVGHDGDPALWERGDELRLRARDSVDRADELEVDRPDGGDHADVRPRDLAELGDLAEAAHRQLDDADLGVGLEPAERQRDAELGVVAPLGRDRADDAARRARQGCPSSRSCQSSR